MIACAHRYSTSFVSDLNGSTTDIQASAVLSIDGLIMTSMLPGSMDEDRVSAMSAAMLSLGERISSEKVLQGMKIAVSTS
ncbi:MAG: roadblock/LC7 domain-containing protein [Granulosicoccus sp.]